MSQRELAKRCHLSDRTVRRWICGDKVDNVTLEVICETLDVPHYYFERPERVRDLFRECGEQLEERAPVFDAALKQLARTSHASVFERLCTDLVDRCGARIVRPSTRGLESTVRSVEELKVVETFLGYALLMVINPDHLLSVRVDGVNPIRLRGISEDVVPDC